MNTVILMNKVQTMLTDSYTKHPVGMLPLIDRPAISYVLTRLAQQGITNITLAVSDATHEVVSTLGDGTKDGLELSYINTDRDDDMRWFLETGKGVFKIIDDNVALEDLSDSLLTGAHLFTQHGDGAESSVLHIHNAAYALEIIKSGSTCSFMQPDPCDQLARYHAQNLLLLGENYTDLTPPFAIQCIEERSVINRGASLNVRTIKGENVFVGQFAAIHRHSYIKDNVVIGAGSTIDQHVGLSNVVVLPNTWVRANRDFSNCVISSDWIYSLADREFVLSARPRFIARSA